MVGDEARGTGTRVCVGGGGEGKREGERFKAS